MDSLIFFDAILIFHVRLGSDPEKLFPYELMLKHFHNFGRLALMLVSIMFPLIITEDESGAAVAGQNGIDQSSKVDNRLKDIIADMVRLGYI